jgi:hypothetical protein
MPPSVRGSRNHRRELSSGVRACSRSRPS